MGLDSSIYAVNQEDVINDFGFNGFDKDGISIDPSEICYARKNWLLHHWMEDLYYRKGGKAEQFNGEYVRVLKEDLDLFEEDVKFECLERVHDEYECAVVKDLIRECKISLEDGKALYYYSNW